MRANVDLNDATMNDLQMVVKEFHHKKQNGVAQSAQQNEDNDEFGDFVEPEQHHGHSNFYQDFNWDFLAEKKDDSGQKILLGKTSAKNETPKKTHMIEPK